MCPWPTFHASVTKTQNGNCGATVMVPITIMSSFEMIIQIRCSRVTHTYRIWNVFSFHKYRMKWKLISDSFYHMLNSQKRKKDAVLSSFFYRFYCRNCANVGALPTTSKTNCDVSAYQNASLHYVINIGYEMNFHFIQYLWNELSVLYPRAFGGGYKTHNEFHKYHMKWKFISDSFYHMILPKNINISRKKYVFLGKFCAKIALKRRDLRDVIMLLLMTLLAKERETAVKSIM